jgi:hypothetical protein
MTEALRFNEGKPQLSYILYYGKAIELLARVLEYGECKYDHLNWKKGNKPNEEYLDAHMRHMEKVFREGPIDPKTGCHHYGHALWNLMTLIELNDIGPILDQELFEECKKKALAEKAKRNATS